MNNTGIQWTDRSWNPTTGCTKVSQGCKHCYAERVFPRTYPDRKFIDVRTHAERLEQPLRINKPQRIFVNSMSDLFHEDVPDEFIAEVFAIMARCQQHTFQVLTKRPERMQTFCSREAHWWGNKADIAWRADYARHLPNVWLGVSVEDQATADERIPLLLQTPAAIRFISYEPALGPLNPEAFCGYGFCDEYGCDDRGKRWPLIDWPLDADVRRCRSCGSLTIWEDRGIDWVIVGGESGPRARLFDLQWARSIIAQCQAAGVACFVKQLGARPHFGDMTEPPDYENFCVELVTGLVRPRLRDRAGGDMNEWPEDLRVREFPK